MQLEFNFSFFGLQMGHSTFNVFKFTLICIWLEFRLGYLVLDN